MPRIPFIQIKDKGEVADAILTEFLDRELIEKVKATDMKEWYKL